MLKKTVYLSLFALVAAGFAYGYRALVQRFLGLEAYGQVGIVLAVLNIITLVILSAIPPAIARYRAEGRELLDSALKFAWIGVDIALILLLLSPLFVYWYELPMSFVVMLAASVVVLTFVAIGRGILQGSGRTTMFGFTQFIEEGGRLLFAILFIWGSYLAFGAVFAILLGSILTAAFVLFAVRKEGNGFEFKPLLDYMVPISITRVVDGLILNMDLLLLKIWVPMNVIGMYSIAGPLGRIPLLVFAAIATILLPEVARNKDRVMGLTKEAVFIAGLILGGIVVLAAFPVFFIELLFSTAEMTAEDLAATGKTLQILAVAGFFMGIYKILTSAIQGIGLAKKIVPLAIGVLVLDVILMGVLVPAYGMTGAASATLVASIAASLGSVHVLRMSNSGWKSIKRA